MRNVKVRIKNKTESTLFQRMVFASGGRWGDGGQDVKRTDANFLFVNQKGLMTYIKSKPAKRNSQFFDEHRYFDITDQIKEKAKACKKKMVSLNELDGFVIEINKLTGN